MDEILSSIRKIIETGEPHSDIANPGPAAPANDTRGDVGKPKTAGESKTAGEPIVPPRNDQRPDIEAGGQRPAKSEAGPQMGDTTATGASGDRRPPMSDTELERFPQSIDARSGDPVASSSSSTAAPDVSVTAGDKSASGRPSSKYEARFTETESQAFASVGRALSEATGEAAITPRPSAEDRPSSDVGGGILKPESAADIGAAATAIRPLISADVQKSVGMSFKALSQTLKQQTGRDLDAVAEDMLRPMLSDWLDNNLPAMVERLVRAEIERIARGEPRRG